MKFTEFLIQWGLTILICFAAYAGLKWLIPSVDYPKIQIIAVSCFASISMIIYLLSIKSANSPNKFQFMNVVIMNIFIKMIVSFLLIVAYVQMNAPTDKLYVLPFMMVYLIFTIFETYFLMKTAKPN